MALHQEENAQRCPDCGTFEWEWEEDPQAWEAGLHWCLGCREIDLERRAVVNEADRDPEGRAGWRIRLYRRSNDGE